MEVNVNIINQKIKIETNQRHYTAGSQNYVNFKFSFPDDWNDMDIYVQFIQNGRAYTSMVGKSNIASLPSNIMPGTCSMVLCGKSKSSSSAEIRAITDYITLYISKNKLVTNALDINISNDLYISLTQALNNLIDQNDDIVFRSDIDTVLNAQSSNPVKNSAVSLKFTEISDKIIQSVSQLSVTLSGYTNGIFRFTGGLVDTGAQETDYYKLSVTDAPLNDYKEAQSTSWNSDPANSCLLISYGNYQIYICDMDNVVWTRTKSGSFWTEWKSHEDEIRSVALAKDNAAEFTPTSSYNPATKKYVDDSVNDKISITGLGKLEDPDAVLDTMTQSGLYKYTDADGFERRLMITSSVGSVVQIQNTTEIGDIYIRFGEVSDNGITWYEWDTIATLGTLRNNYLSKYNATAYTPTGDYNPATKKYVDDLIGKIETEAAAINTIIGGEAQ